MATIKQYSVIVRNVTDKDNPFIAETHIIRAKSKAEACDVVWEELARELFLQDGTVGNNTAIVRKMYKLNCDVVRQLQATGYQTRDAREAAKAKARKKAAAKKAAEKAANKSGAVRVSHV